MLPKTCHCTLMSNDLSRLITRFAFPRVGCSVTATMPVNWPSMQGSVGPAGGMFGSNVAVMGSSLGEGDSTFRSSKGIVGPAAKRALRARLNGGDAVQG